MSDFFFRFAGAELEGARQRLRERAKVCRSYVPLHARDKTRP